MSELILKVRQAIALPFGWVLPGVQTRSRSAVVSADGRLYALDFARFMAMVFMMQGHVLDAVVSQSYISVTEFPWNIWHIVRGFTAPTFLMVSGAVHVFATRREEDGTVKADLLSRRIRWALTIIGIGYFMMFPANSLWDLPYVQPVTWNTFLAVNILHLTGVTLLLYVLVAASTKNVQQLGRRALGVSIAILALTPLMQNPSVTAGLPKWLVPYINISTGSLFPVFPFAAFLFVGLFVGSLMHAAPREQRNEVLKTYAWRIGLITALLGFLATYIMQKTGVNPEYYSSSMSIPTFVLRVGVVLCFFSLSVWILERTWSLRNWYSVLGKKSLYIYIIHLVLLFGTPWASSFGRTHYRALSLQQGIVVALIIILVTLAIAITMDWIGRQKWFERKKQIVQYALLGTIAFVLFT
ncbi:MAG: DUF1624 domain-containing protein [Chlorobi bacterium]|nr:MAG: DUF1624 domain-containing protein [Bacteroidota bacterium]KXK32510.1 MAG: acyltransferase domain-containing protein [Chlorobi bacterium OLB6]MBE2266247.1 DUF1624 domain-containing protein [Flavobacteriales bacterium]MBL1161613.1 DUF1624 domain-containing protein [Chlorobiota bacterium]MBW7852761.1 DUF1624 domain-containing protein [Candidatus Kapabacteria bacterium]MCC6332342.1 DUF1624 domain-containing protein [Ignavibacteria bacterium]